MYCWQQNTLSYKSLFTCSGQPVKLNLESCQNFHLLIKKSVLKETLHRIFNIQDDKIILDLEDLDITPYSVLGLFRHIGGKRTFYIFSHPEDGSSNSLRNTETNKTHRKMCELKRLPPFESYIS